MPCDLCFSLPRTAVLDFVGDRAAPRPGWEPRHPHPLPLSLGALWLWTRAVDLQACGQAGGLRSPAFPSSPYGVWRLLTLRPLC